MSWLKSLGPSQNTALWFNQCVANHLLPTIGKNPGFITGEARMPSLLPLRYT